MALHGVFNNGETETRTARLPGAPQVYSIESFGDSRNVFLRDANSGIYHEKNRAGAIPAPPNLDVAIFGRKSDGIIDEVEK